MTNKKNGRGGKRSNAGRRPKRGTPMPKTGITASAEQLIFYYLLSGHGMGVSPGVQIAVDRLVNLDEKYVLLLEKARKIIAIAKENLENNGVEPTQVEVYAYWNNHIHELLDMEV